MLTPRLLGVSEDQALRPILRPCPALPSAHVRRFSEVAVAEPEDGSLISPDDVAPSWLVLRPREAVKAAPQMTPDFGLTTMPVSVVVEEAMALAYTNAWEPEAERRWKEVVEQLLKRELNSSQALLVFHCVVQLGYHHPLLLERVADRLESRYFSASHDIEEDVEDDVEALGQQRSPKGHAAELLSLFPHEGSFQSLIENLPLSHKVALILIRCTSRPRRGGISRPRMELPPETDAKKAWKTADPVDMEAQSRAG
eukprot:s526_g10.t1